VIEAVADGLVEVVSEESERLTRIVSEILLANHLDFPDRESACETEAGCASGCVATR
jgi:hypothetical protein